MPAPRSPHLECRAEPAELGGARETWCDRGDPAFPVFHAGPVSFGLNICTELWALETYGSYAALGADLVLSPRATAFATTTRWVSAGVAARAKASYPRYVFAD